MQYWEIIADKLSARRLGDWFAYFALVVAVLAVAKVIALGLFSS
jgi:hypothetical protein